MKNNLNHFNLLLRNLFEDLGYNNKDFFNVKPGDEMLVGSFFAKDIFKKNSFLVLFLKQAFDLEQIKKNQSEYFHLMKAEIVDDPDIDKNTTLLICLETLEEPINEILKIEEDPYFFKKYVFTYSLNQYKSFIEEYALDISEKGMKRTLDSIINDIELFKNFKQNPEDRQSVYGFVSRLFIKIPILTMNISGGKAIYSLSNKINESLDTKGILDLKNRLLAKDSSKLNDNEIFSIINDLYIEEEC